MSAGNYIGYFAYLVEKGRMTEDEASERLKRLHEIDMMQDEFDREFFAKYLKEHCQHGDIYAINNDGAIGEKIGTCSILKGEIKIEF